MLPFAHEARGFRRWCWGLVPLLAVVAYASVLRVGFLGDDLALWGQARERGVSAQALLPDPGWLFYRPLGVLFIWDVGAPVWGRDPLPFHLAGLLAHAAASLALGLWLAEATRRPVLGWLAGSLFAVFPLHLEAVGWIAAQWDAWAALFGLLSLYFFTRWWAALLRIAYYIPARVPGGRHAIRNTQYVIALLCYALGLFTKESLLTWLPLLALSAWLVTPRMQRADWRGLGPALLPFCGVLALNLGLRLAAWGSIGGYRGANTGYGEFLWDGYIAHGRLLLAPLNSAVFGSAAPQIVGLLSSILLLLGLAWYGRGQWRVLLVAGVWLALALLPVLNLPARADDLENNRFLYLPAGGYCAGIAAFAYAAGQSEGRRQKAEGRRQAIGNCLLPSAFCLLIGLGVTACWAQLRPWHTATVEVNEIGQELHRLIPPQPRPKGMVWYVENAPDNYQGAYVLRNGLDGLRYFTSGESMEVRNVERASAAPLTADHRDAFALRFDNTQGASGYHVNYVAGVTWESPPPTPRASVWDFTNCAPDALKTWRAARAEAACVPGKGLVLRPSDNDPQVANLGIALDARANQARFVRLRALVDYPAGGQTGGEVIQWFWRGPDNDWAEERGGSLPIKPDGKPHVYWTFLPAAGAGGVISGLRLDPNNSGATSAIRWIAQDLVK